MIRALLGILRDVAYHATTVCGERGRDGRLWVERGEG